MKLFIENATVNPTSLIVAEEASVIGYRLHIFFTACYALIDFDTTRSEYFSGMSILLRVWLHILYMIFQVLDVILEICTSINVNFVTFYAVDVCAMSHFTLSK